jgi:hypothetical protein
MADAAKSANGAYRFNNLEAVFKAGVPLGAPACFVQRSPYVADRRQVSLEHCIVSRPPARMQDAHGAIRLITRD